MMCLSGKEKIGGDTTAEYISSENPGERKQAMIMYYFLQLKNKGEDTSEIMRQVFGKHQKDLYIHKESKDIAELIKTQFQKCQNVI